MRRWAWLLVMAIFLGAMPLNALADDLPQPSGCSSRSDEIPTTVAQRPVIYVHGWTGDGPGLSEPAGSLQERLGADFRVFKFDYHGLSTTWPVGNKAADCLAYYIQSASKAFGDKPVLAVGHSMGGITLRAAAGVLNALGEGDRLAGVVTLGTPHQGSPLGGTGPAQALQTAITFSSMFSGSRVVLAGSSAAECLATGFPCAKAPYLGGDQKIAMLGTQIVIERRLFNMRFVLDDSRIEVFGDGIVPLASASGYMGSGSGSPTVAQLLGSHTEHCTISSSTVAKFALDSMGVVPAAVKETLGVVSDLSVAKSYRTGKYSPMQLPSIVGTFASPCSHIQLTTYEPIVSRAAQYLRQMAALADRVPEEKERDREFWLYEVGDAESDGTGARTDVSFGSGQSDSQNSTAHRIGCGAEITNSKVYQLEGRFKSFTAEVGHRLGSPPGLESSWRIEVDGQEIDSFELKGRQTKQVVLDLAGASELVVSAGITNDVGCVAAEPYGVLGKAKLVEASDPTSGPTSQPGDASVSLTERYGWPTKRRDSNPAFHTWLGAATAWGKVKLGMVSWLACASNAVCVGGTDKEVLVTATNAGGRYVVAEFVAAEPARSKLLALGANQKELDELLRPS